MWNCVLSLWFSSRVFLFCSWIRHFGRSSPPLAICSSFQQSGQQTNTFWDLSLGIALIDHVLLLLALFLPCSGQLWAWTVLGKPTFLSMSCHPTGPNMAAQPLPGMYSHAGFRKGYPPSLTCFLWYRCWFPFLLIHLLSLLYCLSPLENSFYYLLFFLKRNFQFWNRN